MNTILTTLTAALLLLLAGASPAPRDTSLPVLSCFPAALMANLPYNFTLAAVSLTGPNDNCTGVPLVLASQGAIDGAEFEAVATYATYPYNDLPYLTLTSSGIKAYNAEGESYTNATAAQNASSISFLTTDNPGYGVDPAAVFLAVGCEGNPFPILAANDRTDQWSLCPTQYSETMLIYNSSAEAASPYQSYNVSDCVPVAVNIVPYL